MTLIDLIAVDMDGTLLNSRHELTSRTEQTLKRALDQGVKVVIATGKTRYSATAVLERLPLDTPGVYSQGLIIYNPDGSVRYRTVLEPELARMCVQLGRTHACPLVAYEGMRILTPERSAYTDILADYHEPMPKVIADFEAQTDTLPINKFIFINEPDFIDALRPHVEQAVNGNATVVLSNPRMLEVLPHGASKGAGLQRVLDDLAIPAERVLALGDGENDVEMLRLAGIGVAMANAMEVAKAAADYITASNDEDGVAQAVERFVLSNGHS